jgi:hypothetical protein
VIRAEVTLRSAARRLAAGAALLCLALLGHASAALAQAPDLPEVRPPSVPSPPGSAPTFDEPALDGVSGPRAIETLNLAGTWGFRPEAAPGTAAAEPDGGTLATEIQVPGGGWAKQGFANVNEATYSRTIRIPESARGERVVRLELGAVNHQATLFVDGREVGTNTTSFLPSAFDLTEFVAPGETHEIELRVKGSNAMTSSPAGSGPWVPSGPWLPNYLGPPHTVPTAADWSEVLPQGIFRSAKLRVYPALRVADAQIRPSVADETLRYDVWIENASAERRTAELGATLRSWNDSGWAYPQIPRREVEVGAGETERVTVEVPWTLGRESYWWPNVPYEPDYRAQLHDLELTVDGSTQALYRFGFKEFRQVGTHYELNGIRVNLRGDSLQGGMYDRINHHGRGDAFDTFPGFLPPSEDNPGWPQAVRNYQRLNYNVVRVHQVPATPYMLDVADELGLMIIGESAIRGSEARQSFTGDYDGDGDTEINPHMVNHVRDLVLRDRNHASVIRWSQSNEPDPSASDTVEFERALYETIMAHDPTRPVSIDVVSETYEELKYDNFSVYQHYVDESGVPAAGYTEDVHPRTDRPFGRGEFIWPLNTTRQGFTWFATATEQMREKDAAEIRPYALAGAWASVIPGVLSTDFITDNHTMTPLYGEDNLPDPWNHPQVRRNQAGFHPVLAADRELWDDQAYSDATGAWPATATPSTLRPGESTEREVVVFNDTFAGRRVVLDWQARLGSADGPVIAEGSRGVSVPLGEHRAVPIEFAAPEQAGSRVYLVLATSKGGRELFREEDAYFEVRDGGSDGASVAVADPTPEIGVWSSQARGKGFFYAGASADGSGFVGICSRGDDPYAGWYWIGNPGLFGFNEYWECPSTAGVTAPPGADTAIRDDQDRDGTPDAQDACPAEAGAAQNRGCPEDAGPPADTDGDGLIDDDDECHDEPGPAANQGCPDPDNPPDTTPPETEITSAIGVLHPGETADATFRASEEGASFACAIDSGPFAPCASPLTIAADGFEPGRHVLRVRATDAAGNADPTPAREYFHVSGSRPAPGGGAAPAAPAGAESTDQGTDATEGESAREAKLRRCLRKARAIERSAKRREAVRECRERFGPR